MVLSTESSDDVLQSSLSCGSGEELFDLAQFLPAEVELFLQLGLPSRCCFGGSGSCLTLTGRSREYLPLYIESSCVCDLVKFCYGYVSHNQPLKGSINSGDEFLGVSKSLKFG